MAYTMSDYRVVKSIHTEIYLLISSNWEKFVCKQGKEPYPFETFEGTGAWVGVAEISDWLRETVEDIKCFDMLYQQQLIENDEENNRDENPWESLILIR